MIILKGVIKLRVSKYCIGCQSNRTQDGYCEKMYIRKDRGNIRVFREKFCPCVKCIVKATCQDPKMQILGFDDPKNWDHKCQKFKTQIDAFWDRRTHENKSK